MIAEASTEISEVIQAYTNNLINFRADFLKMIYDSYLEFDFEELENTISINQSERNFHSNQKHNDKKFSHKGFYTTFEQFIKGFEQDKWIEKMNEIFNSVNAQGHKGINKRANLEMKQYDFMAIENIPKKPKKKFTVVTENKKANSDNERLHSFNFKNKDLKIISYSFSSNIKQEKLKRYTKEVITNSMNDKMIKLIDYKDNRVVFMEKIVTDKNISDQPRLLESVDINSLDKRADILVSSRLVFLEKVATTVCKFIIALKKLYKNKKEKEKARGLDGNSRRSLINQKDGYGTIINMSHSPSGANLMKESSNGKFKKVREIISSKSIKTILSNTISNSKHGNNIMDLKKFRKILNKKVDAKEKVKKQDKLNKIKIKIKSMMEKERYEENYDEENAENLNSDADESSINDSKKADVSPITENIEQNEPTVRTVLKKRKTLHNTQIVDIINDIPEEKVIMPKKKVNHIGLKMFIKEEINRMKKK